LPNAVKDAAAVVLIPQPRRFPSTRDTSFVQATHNCLRLINLREALARGLSHQSVTIRVDIGRSVRRRSP
jgi:hypothetical protein